MKTDFDSYLYEETSIRVAEEVGPNAIEYDMLHDRYMDDPEWRATCWATWKSACPKVVHMAADDTEGGEV